MNKLQRWASRFFFGARSPYESANISPRRHVVAGASPQDAQLDLTAGVRGELVRRSRYLVKNSGFLREIVSSMALYSVGDGIRPQAQSTNTEWNREAEAYFARWARRAELTGRFNLSQSQHLICRALDVDGEIFILKTELDGIPKIQLIETHRIGSNDEAEDTVDGIKLSPNGTPISYRLLLDDGSYQDLPARNVLHVFEPDSSSQIRGCPSLQHSINHLIDEMELIALEKHAVKVNADIARVVTSSTPDIDDSDYSITAPAQAEGVDVTYVQKILGGKVVRVAQGESITPYESKRPSPTFTGFLEHLRRDSAQGLLPFEFAIDSSKIGGAGVRLIVAKADRRFGHRQNILIDCLMRPIWLYVIGHAISTGKLKGVENWIECNFTTPRRVTVDAGREAQQNREDIKLGLKTLTDHYAEQGMDITEELENRAREMALIKELAQEYDISPTDLFATITIPQIAP